MHVRPCPQCQSLRLELLCNQDVQLTVTINPEPYPGDREHGYTVAHQHTSSTLVYGITCRDCQYRFPKEGAQESAMPTQSTGLTSDYDTPRAPAQDAANIQQYQKLLEARLPHYIHDVAVRHAMHEAVMSLVRLENALLHAVLSDREERRSHGREHHA